MSPVTRSQIRSITAALKLHPAHQNTEPCQNSATTTVTRTYKRKPRTPKKKSKLRKQAGEPFRFNPEPPRSREVYPVPRPLSPISNIFENIFQKYANLSKGCLGICCCRPKKRVRFNLPNNQSKSPEPFYKRCCTRNNSIASTSASPDSTTTSSYPSSSFYSCSHNSIRSISSKNNITSTSVPLDLTTTSPCPSYPCSHNSIRSVSNRNNIPSTPISPDFATTSSCPSSSFYTCSQNSIKSTEPAQSYSSVHMTTRFLSPVHSFLRSDPAPEDDREKSTGDDILSNLPDMHMDKTAGNVQIDNDETDDEDADVNIDNDETDDEDADVNIEEDEIEEEAEIEEEIVPADEQEMLILDEIEIEEFKPEEHKVKANMVQEEIIEYQVDDHDMFAAEDVVKQEVDAVEGEKEIFLEDNIEVEVALWDESLNIDENVCTEDMEYEDEAICPDDVFSDADSSDISKRAVVSIERFSVNLNFDLTNIFGKMDIEEIEKDANNAILIFTDVISQNDLDEINKNFQNKNIQGNSEEANNGGSPRIRSSEQSQNAPVVNYTNKDITYENTEEKEHCQCADHWISASSEIFKHLTVMNNEESDDKNIIAQQIKEESCSPAVKLEVKEEPNSPLSKNLGYADSVQTCSNYCNEESDMSNSDSDIELEDYEYPNVTYSNTSTGSSEASSSERPMTRQREKNNSVPKKRFSSPKKALITITGCPVPNLRRLLARQYTMHGCPEETCNYVSLHIRKVLTHHVLKHPDPFNMYLFRCTECRQRFATKEILNIHLQDHLSHNICPLCLSSFPSYPYLVEHARMHQRLAKNTVKCEFCDLIFPSKLYLQRHLIEEQRAMKLQLPCHHTRYPYKIPKVKLTRKKVRFNQRKEIIEDRSLVEPKKEVPENIQGKKEL